MVGTTGYILFQNGQFGKGESRTTQSDSRANLKSYINEEYGISFSYPDSLNVTGELVFNDNFILDLGDLQDRLKYSLVIGHKTNVEGKVESTIVSNDIEWNVHAMVCNMGSAECGKGRRSYETKKDELFVSISFSDTKEGQENNDIDTIVSTFKFVD